MELETAVAVHPTIKLDSSDGKRFDVELDVIKMSKLISSMIEGMCLIVIKNLCSDLGMDEKSEESMSTPIPLENVDAATLTKVSSDYY